MKIYYYDKSREHKSSDTDLYIIKSLREYCKEENIPLVGSVRVLRTELGKPYVDMENVYIGVSHTENLLVIAIDKKDFGIDCERLDRTVRNRYAIADRYFSEKEKVYVMPRCGEAEGKDELRFIETWVKKEAVVKYIGTGLCDIDKVDTFCAGGTFKEIYREGYMIYVYYPQSEEQP